MATRKKASRKSAAKRSKASNRPQDAIALLKADHAKVQDLFDQFETARRDDQKRKLAQTICRELTIHTTIEEEIFYPAAREATEDEDLLDEATVEHASAKELIGQIEDGEPGEEMWDAKVKVLGEYIKHHVKEEETEMFPEIRKTDLDLKTLGEQLLSRKEELMSSE